MAAQYRMPAEFAPHKATWLAWPHETTDWPGKFAPIPWVYGEIVRHLSKVELVRILIGGKEAEQKARKILEKSGAQMAAVEFFHAATDRSWTRDYCPIFAFGGKKQKTLLNWRFNGWAKYPNAKHDDAVTTKLATKLKLPMVTPELNGERIVLEGGSLDVNGQGAMLTTEECLLSGVQARNPRFSRADYETVFRRYLGVSQTIWLKNGIAGDDTHGHVDDLARFTDANTIVVASEENKDEANYEALRENFLLLKKLSYKIEKLPMPEPVFFDGQRLPASYANFYIANKLVLVPTFNDKNDRVALNKLAQLFPDRAVAGIAATDLVLGLGTLHCMTQQEPV